MERIYSRIKPDILLHTINKFDETSNPRQDLSPESEYLQVARLLMNKGKIVKSHKHIQNIRTIEITQESWLVLKGEIKANLYDIDDNLIKEEVLRQGDCLVTFRGGHELIVLEENTVLYEFKNGPYLGKEKDNSPIG